MEKAIKNAITECANAAANSTHSAMSMQHAQAVLNLTQALATLKDIKS